MITSVLLEEMSIFSQLLTISLSILLITVPLKDRSALIVAQVLVKIFYLVHGAYDVQMSDNGLEFLFKNQILANICFRNKVSTQCHGLPNCNATVERVHSSLHNMSQKMK